MPTGVETAGLVLAVLPLLIEALDRWHSGFVKVKAIAGLSEKQRARLRLKIKGLVDLLQSHHGQLSMDIKRLILSAKPDEDIDRLPQDYCSSLWTGPAASAVELYLKKHGGDLVVTAFRGLLQNYHSLAEDIAERFDHYLRKPGVNKRDLKALCDLQRRAGFKTTFGQRLRFTFSETEIDELCARLRDHTSTIGSLIDSATELERLVTDVSISGRTKSVSKITKHLYSIRRQAAVLYLALNKAWKPDCFHTNHMTLLYLNSDDISSDTAPVREVVFHLAFQWQASATIKEFWQDSMVLTKPSTLPQLAAPTGNVTVTFQQSPQQALEVEDICQDILSASQKRCGLLLSLSSDDEKLFPASNNPKPRVKIVPSNAKIMTLRTFLESSTRKLADSQIVELAVKIASSVLRFNNTPWLRNGWRKDSLYFFQDVLSPATIDADHVFIAEPFPCVGQVACCQSEPEETLLELAVLFMELYHHKTFEGWVSETFPNLDLQLLDDADWKRVYGSKWFKRLPQSAKIWDVVKICIEPSPLHQFEQNWEDVDYRCGYFASIVWPLMTTRKTSV